MDGWMDGWMGEWIEGLLMCWNDEWMKKKSEDAEQMLIVRRARLQNALGAPEALSRVFTVFLQTHTFEKAAFLLLLAELDCSDPGLLDVSVAGGQNEDVGAAEPALPYCPAARLAADALRLTQALRLRRKLARQDEA